LSDIKENQKWDAVEGIYNKFKEHSLGEYTPTAFAKMYEDSSGFAEGIKKGIESVYAN